MGRVAFGVYVHVPFCVRRCDYCDFATWTDRAHLVDDYVEGCVDEIGIRARRGELEDATSVFFGGGTPSLLTPRQLQAILDRVPRRSDAEVTVECNPDSVDLERLRGYRRTGVNRLSFGVQSTVPHVLRALGRTHDPDNVARALAWARDAGFGSVNVDLIYGASGETVGDWRRSLEEVLALAPDHVSLYALTVEPGTPLWAAVERGALPAPDDDEQARKYEVADALLTSQGRPWYELSNFARPGHECRHNLLVWAGGDYAGIGCAAHGHRRGRRAWNLRRPERYLAAVRAGRVPEAGAEVLDAAERDHERRMLRLRTRTGIGRGEANPDAATELVATGHLEADGAVLRLTRAGRLLASEVTRRLLVPPGQPVGVGTR